MKRHIINLIIAICAISTAMSQSGNVNQYGTFKNQNQSRNYDSLLSQLHVRNASQSYTRFYNEFININPSSIDMTGALSDEVYEKRLKMMATEIQLPYNSIVKSHILVYTRKGQIENILGRAQYYFPIFEEALYRHGLPMELKMLPVIESALIPKALSTAAAVGLWQFIPSTGKSYGLEINSFVDERSDPWKSTEAACQYLKDLYRTYGDWTLVIAAYNCGSPRVNKALARVPNANNYWDIYELLPRETRGYLPAFIGASYAYTYHKAHNMTPTPLSYSLATDTVMINRMLHFDQISTTINISTSVLRDLNPQYRIDIIPALSTKYPLVLPQSEITNFISHEKEIYGKDSLYLSKYLNVNNLSDAARVSENHKTTKGTPKAKSSGKATTYKVKAGDTLGSISKKQGVKQSDIKAWNKIKGTSIRKGQLLTLYK